MMKIEVQNVELQIKKENIPWCIIYGPMKNIYGIERQFIDEIAREGGEPIQGNTS